ncbi:MAG: RNA-binding cell elongation regulator Jag/EloR [Oscillospiraceae bacterium]
MREIIMTGKTVEDATELALAELGLSREEVSVEIIDMPAKKLFKNIPAKVKVICDADVDAEALAKAQAATSEKAVKANETKAPSANTVNAEKQHVNTKDEDAVPMDIADSEKATLAVEFLTEICTKMGVENIKITAEKRGEVIILKIDGPNVGALIGRRGETMEALSYLAGLVANHIGGDYAKIGIDVGGYRSKREDDLSALAKRIAEKVVKTGRSQALEPMNPYERRIIHSAVSEVEGVKSESTGEGASRRVVIISTGANAKNALPERYDRPFKSEGDRPRSGYQGKGAPRKPYSKQDDRGPKRSGGFKESSVPARNFKDRVPTDAAPIVPKRTETVSDGDFPLYGKIEL